MYYLKFNKDDVLETKYIKGVHDDKLLESCVEVSEGVFTSIIQDPDWVWKINRDTGEIYKTPLPEPEPYVPKQITRAQGKAALIQVGLWQSVESYVDEIEDATEKALALVALNDTTHWSRTSPFLNKAAKAIGLTDNDLDNLFIESAKIEL